MKRPNYLLYPIRPLRRRLRRPPPGASPGTLPPVRPEATPPRVTVLAYGPDTLIEREVTDLGELRALRGEWPVLWVNVDGVEHADTIRALGEIFGLHRLALEDVVNVPQRAKVEDYGAYLFIVAQSATMQPAVDTEQMGIFLGRDFVLTFQEAPGDPLNPVRERIRGRIGRIRSAGPDYLAYAVIDAIIDFYFPLLEEIADRLDDLEEQILRAPSRPTVAALYAVRRDLTTVRRALWPARDALASLSREPNELIENETRIYLRDCYDHVVQCLDLVESDRDLTSSLTDLYLSSIGQRTNEIVRVLTMFSVIFTPMTLIAGIYGMNFDPDASPWNMPELRWFWGYPFALALMAVVAVGMLVYFRRKGWIAEPSPEAHPSDRTEVVRRG